MKGSDDLSGKISAARNGGDVSQAKSAKSGGELWRYVPIGAAAVCCKVVERVLQVGCKGVSRRLNEVARYVFGKGVGNRSGASVFSGGVAGRNAEGVLNRTQGQKKAAQKQARLVKGCGMLKGGRRGSVWVLSPANVL